MTSPEWCRWRASEVQITHWGEGRDVVNSRGCARNVPAGDCRGPSRRPRPLCSCLRWLPQLCAQEGSVHSWTHSQCMRVCVWRWGAWGPAHRTAWKLQVKASSSPQGHLSCRKACFFQRGRSPPHPCHIWARGQSPPAFCSSGTSFPPAGRSPLRLHPLPSAPPSTQESPNKSPEPTQSGPCSPCLRIKPRAGGGREGDSWPPWRVLRVPELFLVPV